MITLVEQPHDLPRMKELSKQHVTVSNQRIHVMNSLFYKKFTLTYSQENFANNIMVKNLQKFLTIAAE
jgi:hypothetical protein